MHLASRRMRRRLLEVYEDHREKQIRLLDREAKLHDAAEKTERYARNFTSRGFFSLPGKLLILDKILSAIAVAKFGAKLTPKGIQAIDEIRTNLNGDRSVIRAPFKKTVLGESGLREATDYFGFIKPEMLFGNEKITGGVQPGFLKRMAGLLDPTLSANSFAPVKALDDWVGKPVRRAVSRGLKWLHGKHVNAPKLDAAGKWLRNLEVSDPRNPAYYARRFTGDNFKDARWLIKAATRPLSIAAGSAAKIGTVGAIVGAPLLAGMALRGRDERQRGYYNQGMIPPRQRQMDQRQYQEELMRQHHYMNYGGYPGY